MGSNMLAQIQESPMSVCVDATLWQTYTGGVITTSSGCGTSIDHAVQATGYNAAGNYWIVRNSWSESWARMVSCGSKLARMSVVSPARPPLSQLSRSWERAQMSWYKICFAPKRIFFDTWGSRCKSLPLRFECVSWPSVVIQDLC